MQGDSSRFLIRSYRPGDEVKINEMFNEVFQQERGLSHWCWKYRDNPYGSYVISLAESSDGELAAHYGGYPVRMFRQHSQGQAAEEFTTFHIGDKMTRQKFRSVGFRKGTLLARTFFHFRDTYGGDDRGVPFAYGFTTHHSKRFGELFLDYAVVEPVPHRVLGADGLGRLQSGRLVEMLAGITVRQVNDVDDEWSGFFNSVAPSYRYLVKREARYLRWRYFGRPDRTYLVLAAGRGSRLAGWSVFFREGDRIIWGDALFRPGDFRSAAAILNTLRKHPLAAGAGRIEGWFPPRPEWWDDILRRLGFSSQAEPNGLHLTPPIFTRRDVVTEMKDSLYYTWGDSDLF